jgi:2'-5' RNA ligase
LNLYDVYSIENGGGQMAQAADKKRLLFGLEAHAPWPESLADVKTLKARHRHLTLVYFGDVSYKKLHDEIRYMPKPDFRVGPVAISDSSLSLSNRSPDMIAWHVDPFGSDLINDYQYELVEYFTEKGYDFDKKKYVKHITLGKSSLLKKEMKKSFKPLPLYFSNLHLYESLKGDQYEPIWTYDLLPPFEEGKGGQFILYGESFQQIFLNAQIALAFKCPELVPFLDPSYQVRNLHDGGIRLTTLLNQAYRALKIPIEKATFLDSGKQDKGILSWPLQVKYSS